MVSGAMNVNVTPDVVAEKTTKYFGASRGAVRISNIEKGALSTAYQARYGGNLYNCTIYYGEVTCKQPGS
jgi:hypothetical protein